METWYLLYGGTSADGLGKGYYVGRTTDMFTAIEHFNKQKNDPFSIGEVQIVRDDEITVAYYLNDFREK